MVIISALVSLTDVVIKAATLLSQLPEKWYKDDDPELEKFKTILSRLSQSARQLETHVQQNGISESPAYIALLAKAVDLLDVEKDCHEKHGRSGSSSRSWARPLKQQRRPFPSQLTYNLSNILELVQESPEERARGRQTQELLAKIALTDASGLPFEHDSKYVPPRHAFNHVRRALVDKKGPQVVMLYGAPGMGKSSLAKYLALHYQDLVRRSTSCFDGVHYLFCGQGCRKNLYRLRKEFFENLGFGVLFSNLKIDADEERPGLDYNLSRYQSALRGLLAERKLLVVLDDVWEEDSAVLTNFISRGTPCKYLLTSHTKSVWLDAEFILMPSPTEQEALNIFTNHIQRSWNRGHFESPICETSMEIEVKEMMEKLGYHPLSIVNLAVSLIRDGVLDFNRWNTLRQNYFAFLEQNRHTDPVLVYERPYSLTLSVAASMMLMVESLREMERDLLYLIALLECPWEFTIPENLIRFFLKRFYRDNPSLAIFKYFSALKHLEDNSLVHIARFQDYDRDERWQRHATSLVDSAGIKQMSVTIHSLRREYIRRKSLPTLQSMASTLLAEHGHNHLHGCLENVRNSDQRLAVVLGVVHFDEAFLDKVALPFQSIRKQVIGEAFGTLRSLQSPGSSAMRVGAVPRGPQQMVEARELVTSAKERCRDFLNVIGILMELLSLEGEERWKQQACHDANKMLMKFVCQEELDDSSMASLLIIPHTREAGYIIFAESYIILYETNMQHDFDFGHCNSLSDRLPETWRTLSNLINKKIMPAAKYGTGSMSHIIQCMWQFELESVALTELQKLQEIAASVPDSLFQDAVHESFLYLHRSRFSLEVLGSLNLHEYLPTILWRLIRLWDDLDHDNFADRARRDYLYRTYDDAINCFKNSKDYVKILLTFPTPCSEWLTNGSVFRQLLKLETESNVDSSFLGLLSGTSEFQDEATRVLRGDCWEKVDFMVCPETFSHHLARFWGNLALLKDIHASVRLSLIRIAEDWAVKLREYTSGDVLCSSCKCACSDGSCCTCQVDQKSISIWSIEEVTRAVTIIMHLHGSPPTLALEGLQEKWTNSTCESCMANGYCFYSRACRGQALAYHQMEMYAEALIFLDLEQQALLTMSMASTVRGTILGTNVRLPASYHQHELSSYTMLVKASSGDYQGALGILYQYEKALAPSAATQHIVQLLYFANRAVLLKLTGEFSKAVEDFDEALECWSEMIEIPSYQGYGGRLWNFLKCCLLEHRGHAKRAMEDLEGCRLDLEAAEFLRSSELTLKPLNWDVLLNGHLRWDHELELGHSLLQLPANNNNDQQ